MAAMAVMTAKTTARVLKLSLFYRLELAAQRLSFESASRACDTPIQLSCACHVPWHAAHLLVGNLHILEVILEEGEVAFALLPPRDTR